MMASSLIVLLASFLMMPIEVPYTIGWHFKTQIFLLIYREITNESYFAKYESKTKRDNSHNSTHTIWKYLSTGGLFMSQINKT